MKDQFQTGRTKAMNFILMLILKFLPRTVSGSKLFRNESFAFSEVNLYEMRNLENFCRSMRNLRKGRGEIGEENSGSHYQFLTIFDTLTMSQCLSAKLSK
jgi:hypothetical protein